MTKKKIISGIAALAIVGAIAFNVNISSKSNNFSNVLLTNVEALAQNDVGDPNGSGCNWGRVSGSGIGAWLKNCMGCGMDTFDDVYGWEYGC